MLCYMNAKLINITLFCNLFNKEVINNHQQDITTNFHFGKLLINPKSVYT